MKNIYGDIYEQIYSNMCRIIWDECEEQYSQEDWKKTIFVFWGDTYDRSGRLDICSCCRRWFQE